MSPKPSVWHGPPPSSMSYSYTTKKQKERFERFFHGPFSKGDLIFKRIQKEYELQELVLGTLGSAGQASLSKPSVASIPLHKISLAVKNVKEALEKENKQVGRLLLALEDGKTVEHSELVSLVGFYLIGRFLSETDLDVDQAYYYDQTGDVDPYEMVTPLEDYTTTAAPISPSPIWTTSTTTIANPPVVQNPTTLIKNAPPVILATPSVITDIKTYGSPPYKIQGGSSNMLNDMAHSYYKKRKQPTYRVLKCWNMEQNAVEWVSLVGCKPGVHGNVEYGAGDPYSEYSKVEENQGHERFVSIKDFVDLVNVEATKLHNASPNPVRIFSGSFVTSTNTIPAGATTITGFTSNPILNNGPISTTGTISLKPISITFEKDKVEFKNGKPTGKTKK